MEICVCGAVHGSNALQRQVVVHHGEHTLLHLAAVPCVDDGSFALCDVEEDSGLGVEAQLFVVLDFSLGGIEDYEIRLEVLKLFLCRLDEHVLDKVCLPCHFHNEADSHAGVFVGAAECVGDIQLLAGQLFHSDVFAGLPGFLGSNVVVIGILGGGPPHGVFGVLIHDDEFVFRRTAGVDTGHNIDSTQFGLHALVKAFQILLHLFLIQEFERRIVDDLCNASDAILSKIEICHSSFLS